MRKLICTAIALLVLDQPVLAQTLEKPECNKANIDSTDEKIARMKDGRNKETAITEIATARDMLGKGQVDDCQTALLKASMQTK